MKNILSSTFLIVFAFAICTMMFACGKSGGGKVTVTPPPTGGHTVKFTVTVAGSVSPANAGLIVLGFGATDAVNPSNNTLWKVNNVERKNESALGFVGTDFPQGKTTSIVIESTVPVKNPVANLDFDNGTGLPAYIISFKAEIDGKVKNDDENISITHTNDYIHDYTY